MSTTTKKTKPIKGFSDFERQAMKERALELRAEERMNKDRAAGEKAIQDKIAEMPAADKAMAERIHQLVTTTAPNLAPKTWYGMPAYANKEGKVVCFFQSGAKYKVRYCTLGFSDSANLDEGSMWPASFALKKLTKADEEKIIELVKRAVS